MNNKIWISWETQRRTIELSEAFAAKLFILETKQRGILRYIQLSLRTIKIIAHEKPDIVFTQNPSIILATVALLIRPFFGYFLVVDRHTNFKFEHRYSKNPKWVIFQNLSRITLKHADATIVTNRYLKAYLSKETKNPIVLPDKIPRIPVEPANSKTKSALSAIFVCTFAEDEPYIDVLSAMRDHKDIDFFVTGNFKKAGPKIDAFKNQKNINLLGFVSENEYIRTFNEVDFAIVLTTQEFTLNCGAYEALALETPALLASRRTIKNYFNKGFEYCEPSDIHSISEGITKISKNLPALKKEIITAKSEKTEEWKKTFLELNKKLHQLINQKK